MGIGTPMSASGGVMHSRSIVFWIIFVSITATGIVSTEGAQLVRRVFPGDGDVTDADRLAAMMSVHLRSWYSDAQLEHAKLRPLSVDAAVEILRRDRGAAAKARRRRAIAVLAARPDLGEKFQRQIGSLGIKWPTLASALRRHAAAAHPDACPGPPAMDEETQDQLETEAFNTVLALEPEVFADACKALETAPPIISPPGSLYLQIDTAASVEGTLGDVASAVDPRRWDECSIFWSPPPDATYLATATRVPKPSCLMVRDGSAAPAPGETIAPERGLFEHFQLAAYGLYGASLIQADFSIFLLVGATRRSDGYEMSYHLAPLNGWLCGSMQGSTTEVKTDVGYIKVTEDKSKGRLLIAFQKRVDYSPSIWTTLAQEAVRAWGHAVSDEVPNLACCLKP
jgi:hypothetical protein